MKSLFVAAAFAVIAALSLSPASAAQYGPPATGTPHWEWQYHYVGHHPHYQGDWVLVR